MPWDSTFLDVAHFCWLTFNTGVRRTIKVIDSKGFRSIIQFKSFPQNSVPLEYPIVIIFESITYSVELINYTNLFPKHLYFWRLNLGEYWLAEARRDWVRPSTEPLIPLVECRPQPYKSLQCGARGRNRTVTPLSGPGILSPVRLPVSPPGRIQLSSNC